MAWIIYGSAVLIISLLIGLHLGRFRLAYTEMTGMMAGMTMGMLNGFLLGYAAAGLFNSMFWGNLIGIILGTAMGCYFGRAAGLMGIMDGGMGGVMGGSMGAMLMIMLVWPGFVAWTALLLAIIYLAGMAGLVALIEQRAPQQASLHRLLPLFRRAGEPVPGPVSGRAPIDDYYTFLGVAPTATGQEIADAYLNQLSIADEETIDRAERAFSILTDPQRRHAYDARLAASQAAGDCCPPPRRERVAEPAPAATASISAAAASAKRTSVATAPAASRSNAPLHTNGKGKKQGGTARNGATVSASTRSSPKSVTKLQAKKEPPISWVGGVVALGIATILIVWWLFTQANAGSLSVANAYTDNGRSLPAEFVQKLQAEAATVPVDTSGKQSANLVVNGTSMSYKPSVLKVKQGVPVHFDLTVEGRDPGCGRYVGLRGLGVHGIAAPGETTTMDFTPTTSGIFQINCNMQMMNPGYLIVTE